MSRRTFRYDPASGEMVEILRHDDTPSGLLIVPDLPAYTSPIDGKVVDGRAARREDLKRSGCREYDPGERRQAQQAQAQADARLEASIGRTVEKFFYETTPRKRELLVQALQAGLGPQIVRK